jgi:hypothetical protein
MTVDDGGALEDGGVADEADVRNRKPWSSPKVIISNSVAVGVAVDNKGLSHIPDQKFSSTSTS